MNFVSPNVAHPPFLNARCKFLKSRQEVEACTQFLKRNGYVSHSLTCKDWDLAHIIPHIGDGHFLDMGSSDSYILKNLSLKHIQGDTFGIDLRAPDVPVSGARYLVGDLMRTPLPASYLSNITCLSVLEHQVDFASFAAETSRLLTPGGHLYVTFDYWEPKVRPAVTLYGLEWQPLDAAMLNQFIRICDQAGLGLVSDFDWELKDPVIQSDYYSPHPQISYTFGMAVLQRR